MRLRATLQLHGKTATGISIPADVVAGLGPGKRPAVRVTINGYTYRSSVAPMGGQFLLAVSADVRERAGIAAGDEVELDLELDTAPREVQVAGDFAAALDRDAATRQFFNTLSYSNKQRLVLSVEAAKTAETRARRIAAAVGKLHDGRL